MKINTKGCLEVNRVNKKELNILLIEKFPNLIDKYNEEVEWQEGSDTGAHVVYGDVLTPYFIDCIEKNNEEEVIKILKFIEEILKYNVKYSNEVIAFSVLEGIEYKYRDSNLLNGNYGELTKKTLGEIRNFYS
jgi:hypothetical protein